MTQVDFLQWIMYIQNSLSPGHSDVKQHKGLLEIDETIYINHVKAKAQDACSETACC